MLHYTMILTQTVTMKCRHRLLEALTIGVIFSLLGGLLGTIASKILYANRHQAEFWNTHVQGNGGFAYLQMENKPEGHSGIRETFDGQIVYEHYSWIGNRPEEHRGVKDFKGMLAGICSFTGWFVGICLGCIYFLIKAAWLVKEWLVARHNHKFDQAMLQRT